MQVGEINRYRSQRCLRQQDYEEPSWWSHQIRRPFVWLLGWVRLGLSGFQVGRVNVE